MRRVAVAVAACGLLLACSGGDPADGSAGETTTTDETTTTTEASTTTTTERAAAPQVDIEVPAEGYRFELRAFGELTTTGEVAAPDRYRMLQKFEGIRLEVIVVGEQSFIREVDEESIATTPFVEGFAADISAESFLDLTVLDAAILSDGEIDGPLFSAVVERAQLDPVGLVDELLDGDPIIEETDDGTTLEGVFEPGPDITGPLEDAGLEAPNANVRFVIGPDGAPVRADVLLPSEFGDLRSEVHYFYDGAPVITPPPPELIDLTPNITEEALLAFADAPLIAPAAPPPGMDLISAAVLSPSNTLEGCTQVQLEYDTPDGVDFVVLFILPRACAEAFDPTPYDETFAGLPSRFVTTREVLFEATVVQMEGSIPDDAVEALAATLAPTTADALIAAVVPR